MLTETRRDVDADVDGMLRNVDADVYECSRMLTFVDGVQGAPPVAPEIARNRTVRTSAVGCAELLGTPLIVVPAKAGTHVSSDVRPQGPKCRSAVWVPAFAGTTRL